MRSMKYDLGLVFLSYGIAFLGAYLASSSVEQLRLHILRNKEMSHSMFWQVKWFGIIAISLGGVGIWCMHFIGMSAMELIDSNGNRVPFYFNIPLTIISLIIAILMTAAGAFILSKDRLFAKSKSDLLELFIDDLQHLSLSDIKRTKNRTMLRIILTKDLKYLFVGGIVTGSGASIMHYLGMVAVVFNGTITWNPGIVAASVLIGIFAACAAFWILFRLLSIYPWFESLRFASSIIMAAAVCGMHYTGMEAAQFHVDTTSNSDYSQRSNLVSNSDVKIPLLVCLAFVVSLLSMLIFADLRRNIQFYQQSNKRKSLPRYPSHGQLSSPIHSSRRTAKSKSTTIGSTSSHSITHKLKSEEEGGEEKEDREESSRLSAWFLCRSSSLGSHKTRRNSVQIAVANTEATTNIEVSTTTMIIAKEKEEAEEEEEEGLEV